MNLATGSLIFVGFFLLVLGIASKILGISLLEPYISTNIGYLISANACLLLALVIDRFQKG